MQSETLGHEQLARDRRSGDRLFHRDLPGGGFVAIVVSNAPAIERIVRVIVERRADRSRRKGHLPPVILEERWNPERGLGDLYRLASDNVAIARGLLELSRAD